MFFIKENSMSLRRMLVMALVIGLSGAGVAQADAKQVNAEFGSVREPLNIAGLEENALASFQAEAGSAQFDFDHSPSFSPANRTLLSPLVATTIGNWSALGSNADGTNGAISHPGPPGIAQEIDVIAVSGTDVYVGGCFQNAGGDPTADYIAKWDGTSWSGIGNDGAATPNGALKSCIRALAINGTDIYVGGYPSVWVGGAPALYAEYLASWN